MGDHSRVNAARYLSRRRFIRLSASAAGLAVAGRDAGRYARGGSGPRLITTLGDLALPDTGIILPHEHLFFHSPQQEPVQVDDVVEVMQPELDKARAAGVAVLVEASSPSLGRRADIIVAVSRAARLPVVVPTGFYLDPSIPEWARAASEEELRSSPARWCTRRRCDGHLVSRELIGGFRSARRVSISRNARVVNDSFVSIVAVRACASVRRHRIVGGVAATLPGTPSVSR